jgi:peptidoglycan/xylan/chitin deacetylase (PgdA/CDA1 family)
VLSIFVELSLFVFATYKFNRSVLSKEIVTTVISSSSSSSVKSLSPDVVYPKEYLKSDVTEEEVLPTPDMSISYKIPSMMYHHINPDSVNDPKDSVLRGISMSPAKFEADLKDIRDKGYETVFPYEISDKLKRNVKQDKKYVLLTIDDGYEDIYKYAFPLLKKYNMKATYYIMPNFVGRRDDPNRKGTPGDYTTWDELKEMSDSGLINIGSHTMDHAELIAKKYKEADLRYQIFNSKDVLQKKLGIKIRDFCYPYGKYNEDVVKLVKEAGYDTATIIEGKSDINLNNILVWKRFHSSETIPLRNYLK